MLSKEHLQHSKDQRLLLNRVRRYPASRRAEGHSVLRRIRSIHNAKPGSTRLMIWCSKNCSCKNPGFVQIFLPHKRNCKENQTLTGTSKPKCKLALSVLTLGESANYVSSIFY